MKKINKLVKIGCLFCIFFQIIFYIFLIILLSKIKIIHFLNFKIYYIKIFSKEYYYALENNLFNENFLDLLYSFLIFFIPILILPYIRLFNSKSGKFTKIFCGIYGLIWGLFPGLFILLGSYQKESRYLVYF